MATAAQEVDWWWPLLLGAGLTLAAGLVGKGFEARRAKGAWLRDQKLRCFAAFSAESHEAARLVGDLGTEVARTAAELPTVADPMTQAEHDASRSANAAVALVFSRAAEVKLLGGKEVHELADKVAERLDDLSGVFHSREWLGSRSVNELVDAINSHVGVVALNSALDAFAEAARREIL